MDSFATEFSIALFANETGAVDALDSLEAERKGKPAPIGNVAVLRKDAEGKHHIYEPGDMGGGKGAAIGAAIGTAIGAITGPGAILTGAAGALIGGLAAKWSDSGFQNDDLEVMANALKPGTSALLVIVADEFLGEFANRMRARNAEVIHDVLHPMVTEQLLAEHGPFLAALGIAGADGLTKASAHEIKGAVEKIRTEQHGINVTPDLATQNPDKPF